jgi:isoamylase
MEAIKVYPGTPYPIGATWDGEGVNFALHSEYATAVELCLFDAEHGTGETHRIFLPEHSHQVWHGYVPGLKPGQLYGFRVHGPYDPTNGHRFNPNKVLIDPYAKAIAGVVEWHDSLFGYNFDADEKDLSFSESDSAPYIPKSVVVDDAAYDWEGDKRSRVSYHNSIIYEMHVKGFTKLHPGIPEEIRGTYAALGHPVTIQYLKTLGVTTVELMPVHQFVNDHSLIQKGLNNYWGYNTIAFFAPDVRYASADHRGGQVNEFKDMVKALHKAGIEVLLDVVYNHTAEGNELGPTLSFKGIDNATYYRLTEPDKRYYMDYTGTGNTLNARLPNVLRMIMDSLRYWVEVMHVDGFRFDLAPTLARELHEVDRLSAFFHIIHQDPVLAQVKLIAEPWDIGEDGYQVGNFPPGWAEWNGKYRDCIRDYWRGSDSMLGEFAQRFTGSPDLYQDDNRRPTASINFLCAHDGFTLHDLVSYNEKHNEANGEDNRDGEDHNRSWNCGAEGETDDAAVNSLRNLQKRNFLATLFLSQGVPMIVAGDELGKTQKGNNNAYCQDNEISWIDWEHADQALLQFTQRVIALKKAHPSFCRRRWFQGQPIKGSELHDIAWFLPEGGLMEEHNWNEDFAKSLGVFLNGQGLHSVGMKGEKIIDDSFYIIFNAYHDHLDYVLPSTEYAAAWQILLDTANDQESAAVYPASSTIDVAGRSVVLLKSVNS